MSSGGMLWISGYDFLAWRSTICRGNPYADMNVMVTKIKVVLSTSLRGQWDIGSGIARQKCPLTIK